MKWSREILAKFEMSDLSTPDIGVVNYRRSSFDPDYYWDIYLDEKLLKSRYFSRELLDWLIVHEATPPND